jgi:hypothetical protein
MPHETTCPWHIYLRLDDKGKCYITTNGKDQVYGDKEKLIATWSKKTLPNTSIVYTIIDQCNKKGK